MQEPLAIEELVSRVIAFADLKTAAACARVCRLWSAPALDKVWAEIDTEAGGPGLVYLFRLMPEVCYSDGGGVDTEATQPIANAGWDRFAQYARRVQVLNLTEDDVVYSEPNIARITACPLPDPLFPRLRVLYTRVRLDAASYAGSTTYTTKFFSASVREVSVSVATRDDHDSDNEFVAELDVRSWRVTEFFGEVVRRAPGVREVAVSRDFGSFEVREVEAGVLAMLTGLSSLAVLSIECALLTGRVLESVLHHAALTSLNIQSDFEDAHLQEIQLRLREYAQRDAGTSPHPPILPSLTRLVIGLPILQLTQFLDAATPLLKYKTPLHTLRTSFGGITRRSDLDDALRAIAKLTTLRSVTIHQHSRIFTGPALREPMLVGESLKYVHALRELTEFHFTHAYPNEMGDGDVLGLVRACPALQTLKILPRFGINVGGESPSRFTLGLLALLSTQPNNLRTLQYQLHPDELSERASEGPNSRSLPPLDSVGPHLLRAKGSGGFVDVGFDNRSYDVGFVERVTGDHRRVYAYLERCLSGEGAGRAFASMRRLQTKPVFGRLKK